MTTTNAVTTSATCERLTGRVKWFNNKTGYGFITVSDGARAGTDVFAHHSAVCVLSEQYKYLVQGEYVNFELVSSPGGPHEFQAANVSGVNNGKLMCETRREFKIARSNYKTTTPAESSTESAVAPAPEPEPVKKTTRAPRSRGEGPRNAADGGEWISVTSKKPPVADKQPSKPRGRPSKSVGQEAR